MLKLLNSKCFKMNKMIKFYIFIALRKQNYIKNPNICKKCAILLYT